MAGRSLLALLVAGVLGGNAYADHQIGEDAPSTTIDPGEQIVRPPPTYRGTGVEITEHLGAQLPLDAPFRTQDGSVTTLGAVLGQGNLPTILTFNYAECPLLCSMQLTGLTTAMPAVADPKTGVQLVVGGQYRIVTISLEPHETIDKIGKMRARYIGRLPEAERKSAEQGWTYLVPAVTGDDSQIRRVADVVGFKYNYVPERAEWAHPAAFIFLDSHGRITRYAHGFELEPQVLRESLVKAGLSEKSTAAGFMHLCYFWDPDANDHSRAGMMALRIGAAGAVVLLLAGIGLLAILRRTAWNTRNDSPSRPVKPPAEEAS